jgi:hypothetical protein
MMGNLARHALTKNAEQFQLADDIVDLVTMLFNVDNVATHLKKVDTSEILEFWSGKLLYTIISQVCGNSDTLYGGKWRWRRRRPVFRRHHELLLMSERIR